MCVSDVYVCVCVCMWVHVERKGEEKKGLIIPKPPLGNTPLSNENGWP